jgi:hypothetical protein
MWFCMGEWSRVTKERKKVCKEARGEERRGRTPSSKKKPILLVPWFLSRLATNQTNFLLFLIANSMYGQPMATDNTNSTVHPSTA